MRPIRDEHVAEPGLAVVDVAADADAFDLQGALAVRWATDDRTTRTPGEPAYGCAATSMCARSFLLRPARPRGRAHGEAGSSPNSGTSVTSTSVRSGAGGVPEPSGTVPGDVDGHLQHHLGRHEDHLERALCPASLPRTSPLPQVRTHRRDQDVGRARPAAWDRVALRPVYCRRPAAS
ncbi:DUF6207 family protein [Streptomyces pseudogriseolus]|uniref:DUF6207 family protein n=1 Tax=Streptomyces pseudogriseolus TaxID=36817 RepID=UPI001CE258E5|nr:DUF6207 family protein [Streptomyces pseudogriseolus]